MRVAADVPLGTLARRLRVLGVDTWWRNDADDEVLAGVAVDQARVLLTRDRGCSMRRAAGHRHVGRCRACAQLSWPGVHADAIAAIVDRAR